MTQLATIRSQVSMLLMNSSMIQASDLTTLIQNCHDTILNDYSWAKRKAETIVSLVAPTSSGTVSTVAGSPNIVGSGTAFVPAHVGRYVRIFQDTTFYKILTVTDATHIVLEDSMPATRSGVAYTMFQHRYDLPVDFGRQISVTSDNRLVEWAKSQIDRLDPYRSSMATKPYVYTIVGLDPLDTSVIGTGYNATAQIFAIEFWPVPASATDVRIEYLRTNALAADTDEPLYRSDVLVWKAAEAAVLALHGKTGDAAWLQLADRFHQRYNEALEGAREDDMGRYSAVGYVQDRAYTQQGFGDDWFISHDPYFLR